MEKTKEDKEIEEIKNANEKVNKIKEAKKQRLGNKEKCKSEKSKNKKDDGTKNKSNKKTKKIILVFAITLIAILCVGLGTLFAIYFNFNYKLYKKVVEENNNGNKNVEVTYKFETLVLSNKNSEYIKENNINLTINHQNYAVTLAYEFLPKYLVFNVDAKLEKSTLEEFKGLDILSINFNKFKFKESISNFKINVDRQIFKNANIDIYKINNNDGKVSNVKKAENIESGNVSFSIYDKNLNYEQNDNTFFLVYVPLQDIAVSKNNIELKKTFSEKIDCSIVPQNATNSKILTKYDTECLSLDNDFNIATNKEGEHKIEFYVQNENIKKEIVVKVLEIASSIEVDKKSLSIELGKTASVKASVIPENAVNKDIEWTSSNTNIATVDENGNITTKKVGKCQITVKTKEEPVIETSINVVVNPKPVLQAAPSAAVNAGSSNGFTYVQGILVVNKKYSIPSTYNPGVNGVALAAFNQMKAAASNEGISLWIVSGFRSYSTQKGLYNRYVSQYGQASADTFSAKPGHSEHQTGLAFDLNSIDDNFGNTKEGIWLARKLS